MPDANRRARLPQPAVRALVRAAGICDHLGACKICGQECGMEALTETRTGKVEVTPV